MLSENQIRRLLDVGFTACHHGNVVDARSIFSGVLALHPESLSAKMGMALSHIVVSEFESAEQILKNEVLAVSPEDTDAQSMLGLCHMLAGQKAEARDVLAPLAAGTGPSAAVALELLEKLDQ